MKLIWKYTFKIILTRKIFYFYWCSKYTRIFFRSKKKNKIDIMSKSCTNPINYESEKIFFFFIYKKRAPSRLRTTNAQLDWNAFGVREVTAPSLPPKSSWSQYKYCLVHYSLIIALQKPNRNLPFLFRPAPAPAPASPGLSL